jgi:TatD DNase family protein
MLNGVVVMLTDTHVHFSAGMTPETVAGLVARAKAAGVGRLVAVGCSPETNEAALMATRAHPDCLVAAVGYDRSLAGSDAVADDIAQLIDSHADVSVAAIGEIGLDFYYTPETAVPQAGLMAGQLKLARARGLPVIVHSREADDVTLELLGAHVAGWRGPADRVGVLHCFTGTEAFAGRLLDLGFMISFSGIVTFRNADPLRAVARMIPEDRLLMETDTPYLTPVPHRGKPNEPCYLPAVAAVLAKVRGVSGEKVAEITTANARRLFGECLTIPLADGG